MAFADGHVEYFVRENLYVHPITGKPSNRLWNGFGRDNDDDGDGVVLAGEPIFDNNEWISDIDGNGVMDVLLTNETDPVIDLDVNVGNGGFLLGGGELRNDADGVNHNRTGLATAKLFLEHPQGPTVPKVAPFPVISATGSGLGGF